MKKNLMICFLVLLLSVSCSDSGKDKNDENIPDADNALSDTETEDEDITVDGENDETAVDADDTDGIQTQDEDSEIPDNDEFLGGFDTAGKECVSDIPDGRLILAAVQNYNDSEAPWRMYVLVLKDDATVVDTGKYFETDPDLEGIGFNSNGRLAAIASWKTGFVTLFALIDSTLCIAQEEIELPNLKVVDDSKERVIFDQIVAHPSDPYKFYLVSGNILEKGDYSNYNGGIYTMTVDKYGKAVISEDHPQMHVPSAFTVLPGGKRALVLGGKEFITEEGSSIGTAGPDDLALLDLEKEIPEVIKWFDIWGATGVNGSGPSMKTMGVSGNGSVMISNSSEFTDDLGKIKLFKYENDNISLITSFTDASLDSPDFIAMNDVGSAAVVMNSLFKGATLGITESEISYVKKETHDLTQPMIKLKGAPFEDHVLIGSFRSSNDESASITIAEITTGGLNEKSSVQIPFEEGFMLNDLAIQE